MTQGEQIIAEIKRLYEKNETYPKKDRDLINIGLYEGRKQALEMLLDFINTLPTEPSEELEYLATSLEETIGTSPHSRETIISYLQQAAQLQKKQTINKAYKWLEDNVIDYVWCSEGDLGISDEFFIDFIKAMEDEQ